MTAELAVVPYLLGWIGVCSEHGQVGAIWVGPELAGYDVLGHAAHHHTAASVSP